MINGKYKIKGEWAAHTSLDAEVVKVSGGEDESFILDVDGAGQLLFTIYDFEDGDYSFGGDEKLRKGMKAKVLIFLDANVEESFK